MDHRHPTIVEVILLVAGPRETQMLLTIMQKKSALKRVSVQKTSRGSRERAAGQTMVLTRPLWAPPRERAWIKKKAFSNAAMAVIRSNRTRIAYVNSRVGSINNISHATVGEAKSGATSGLDLVEKCVATICTKLIGGITKSASYAEETTMLCNNNRGTIRCVGTPHLD